VRHSFRQNRFAATETSTAGYTLLNAHVSYRFGSVKETGVQTELFLRGDNLTDAIARVRLHS